MRNLRGTGLSMTLGVLVFAGSPAPVAGDSANEPITRQEFFDTLNAGQPIRGRSVPASLVAEALRMPIGVVRRWPDTSWSRTSHPESDVRGVFLTSCDIVGDVVLTGITITAPLRLEQVTSHGEWRMEQVTVAGRWVWLAGSAPSVHLEDVVLEDRWTVDATTIKKFRMNEVTSRRSIEFMALTLQDRLFIEHSKFGGAFSFSGHLEGWGYVRDVEFEVPWTRFDGIEVRGGLLVDDVKAAGQLDFTGSTIAGVLRLGRVNAERLNLSRAAVLGSASITDSTFTGVVQLTGINTTRPSRPDYVKSWEACEPHCGTLTIAGSRFGSHTSFRLSGLGALSTTVFESWPHRADQDVSRPTLFEGPVSFNRLKVHRLNLSNVTFADYVDMADAEVKHGLRFTDSVFRGDLSMAGTTLPGTVQSPGECAGREGRPVAPCRFGVSTAGARFLGGLQLDIGQLLEPQSFPKPFILRRDRVAGRTRDDDKGAIESWVSLERAFRRSENLEGANEANFRRRLLETRSKPWGRERLAGEMERLFWGYGSRPLRSLLWLAVLQLVTIPVYYRRIVRPAAGSTSRQGWRAAAETSSSVAVSKTFGIREARTWRGKAFVVAHSAAAKIIAFFAITALARTVPLLHSLMTKVLPI